MIYELHLTVDHNHPDFRLSDWCSWCEHLDAKPLDIRLVEAKNYRQVMFAAVHEGSPLTRREWQNGLTAAVSEAGFSIIRSKLEVPLDKSVEFHPVYHECHIKSLLSRGDRAWVVEYLVDQGWSASWNDLFVEDAGLEKWYFTWRAYDVLFTQAGHEFAVAYANLAEVAWNTVRMECETVIEDSNPQLDEGWAA